MSETPLSPDARQKIRELMGRATLARVRGDRQQALQLAQEALVLNERNYEVHEFIGDLLMDIGRGSEALNSFRRARELNPSRVELEDKVGRAAIQRGAVMDSMAHMQAVLEGRAPQEPRRNVGYAAVASLLCPGLGQIYNGELVKGAVLIVAFVLGLFGLFNSPAIKQAAVPVPWVVALAIIYVFAIGDAAVRASKKADRESGMANRE
jgi:tetratricopeptide (TPR) repeat protein